MNWLMQEPGWIIAGGVLILLALIGGLIKTGQKRLIVAIAATILVTGGLLAAERFVVTDEERVRQTLDEIVRDVQTGNLDKILSHAVADSPAYRGVSRDFRAVPDLEVSITKVHSVKVDDSAETKVADIEFNVVVESSLGNAPFWVKVTFYEEPDGAWRVFQYEYDRPDRALRQ